ncbi:MAG: pyridoxamine 5'-phosphate oxidase [Ignavibacteria bacterium]|nr:pyridoxamine 5'-phosphate oxidase [Ignavibacteria bacterium]
MMKEKQMSLPDLDDGILDPDPIKQFNVWFSLVMDSDAKLPDAVSLATATGSGRPSVRTVLLKRADANGFVFYSNYESRKGAELAENPFAALGFHWPAFDRAVRVEGPVERLSREESERYFATRPRESQLSSLTSAQSRVVPSREDLDRRYEELRRDLEGKPIPCPSYWGGYLLKPVRIEFWQQRFARLNDRIEYTRSGDGRWGMVRLAP